MNIDSRITKVFPYNFDLSTHTICAAYVGSKSHNTYIPSTDPTSIDDVDMFFVVVPPPAYVFGLHKFDSWDLKVDELDVVVYSLEKFVGLMIKNNPNVLGLLWLREQEYIYKHPLFDILIGERGNFSSKQAFKAFSGYAYDQLRRMENIAGKGYLGAKRKKLVEIHGYDTKNAAHLIRLLRTGIDFLKTGELQVYRTTDAEIIKSIKRGEWKLDDIKQEAKSLFEQLNKTADSSTILEKADSKLAEQLLLNITKIMWVNNRELI